MEIYSNLFYIIVSAVLAITSPLALNHVRGLFANHIRGGVGVGGGRFGYDARVDDAQLVDAVDLQFGRYHRRRVALRAHFTSANLMMQGTRNGAN